MSKHQEKDETILTNVELAIEMLEYAKRACKIRSNTERLEKIILETWAFYDDIESRSKKAKEHPTFEDKLAHKGQSKNNQAPKHIQKNPQKKSSISTPYDRSVFQPKIKLLDSARLHVNFIWQEIQQDLFVKNGDLFVFEKTIKQNGFIFTVQLFLPKSLYHHHGKYVGGLPPQILNNREMKVTKNSNVFNIYFTSELTRRDNGKFIYRCSQGSQCKFEVTITPEEESALNSLPKAKIKSNQIYSGENNKFKYCNNCVNITKEGFCQKHKTYVKPSYTCAHFSMPKTYKGGLPS